MAGKSTRLTRQEFENLCAAFTGEFAERNVLLVSLGYYGGSRIAETCALTVGDVTDGNGLVNGRIIGERKNQKGRASGRSVVIHPKLKELLQAYLKAREGASADQALLPSGKGGGHLTPEAASLIFKKACRRVGLGNSVSTHSLRKSFAANVLKGAANNVMIVQRALNHKSLATTLAYLDCTQDDVDSAVMSIH
ncbi:MAG: tyrosine-type recombinase/integrase [Candidatus Coatesbacteria bacterium]|nr:tyrosine-type recombinase/integrase [Candidatus Coatesbacteria bacterium]